MKKWIAALLCLTMALSLSAAAPAEDESARRMLVDEQVQGILGNTADMTDDEIRAEFRRIAEENGFEITDKQLDRLVAVCRVLEGEGLNEEELRQRVERMARDFYQGLTEAPDLFITWLEDVQNGDYTWEDARNSLFDGVGKAAGTLSDFFGGIADFFSGK